MFCYVNGLEITIFNLSIRLDFLQIKSWANFELFFSYLKVSTYHWWTDINQKTSSWSIVWLFLLIKLVKSLDSNE